MTFRALKHTSAVLIALGGIAVAAGKFLTEPVLMFVGGLVAAVSGFCVYLFKEAEEKQRKASEGAPVKPITIPAPTDPVDAHGEIDEAAKHMSEGRPDLSVEKLERIRKKRWDRLSDRERFRVIANLGTAKLKQQKTQEAAAHYIRTVEFQPQDEEAKTYEALGYYFLGDHEKARGLVIAVLKDHPGVGRAQMIRIRTEPRETPFDELLASVPPATRGHSETALALYERAAAEGRLGAAEEIIRGTDLDEWPALPIALGRVLLQQEIASLYIGPEGPRITHPERVKEAVSFLSQGLERLSLGDPSESDVYVLRSACYRLLNDIERAREDVRRAHDLAPTDEQVNLALARLACDEDRFNEAIDILESYLNDHDSLEVEVLLAVLLDKRRDPGDEARAETRLTQVLSSLEEIGQRERVEVVEVLAKLYLRTGRGDQALGLIRGPSGTMLREQEQKVIEGRLLTPMLFI